jgi:hypothetical protein
VPIDWTAALNHISANSLRGHLAFVASDLLEGRDTPSRGLDIAAEYIAAQFRRAGLEPAVKGGYFHESAWKVNQTRFNDFGMRLTLDGKEFEILAEHATILSNKGFDLGGEAMILPSGKPGAAEVQGRVFYSTNKKTPSSMLREGASLVVMLDPTGSIAGMLSGPKPYRERPDSKNAPAILIHRDDLPADIEDGRITLRLSEPAARPFTIRNVAAILPGSDPELSRTFVLVTAHYDHIGALPPAVAGDRVFNGANDDGSGTVAMVEIAGALSRLTSRPKRSVLFVALSGEEKGLLGTSAFANDPPVPLHSMVANVNIEVLGRTDVDGTVQTGRLSVTGIDYSTLGQIIVKAGKESDVDVYKHDLNERFFARSDNLVFARKGIPAHTVSNGFVYPDYHGTGDEWQKVDFDNMARLARTIALAILRLADDPQPPVWADLPATKTYRDAAQKSALPAQ